MPYYYIILYYHLLFLIIKYHILNHLVANIGGNDFSHINYTLLQFWHS